MTIVLQFCASARQIKWRQKLGAVLPHEWIAECVACGRDVTADSVKKQLGARWPLSRRRIGAVSRDVTGGPRTRAANALEAEAVAV